VRLTLRFVLPLLLVLGLLAYGASALVNSTGRRWFEEDVNLRARLAINGAHDALVRPWRDGDRGRTAHVIQELTRDERIMAAAVCGTDLRPLAQTPEFPAGLDCRSVGRHLRRVPEDTADPIRWQAWSRDLVLTGGSAHISALPVADAEGPLGFVILVHDMSYAERREAITQRFTLLAFAVLALVAALVAILVTRVSWRTWTRELRRAIRGRPGRREFQPVLRDVRELVSRLSAETEAEGRGNAWTALRLRQTLKRYLHGEKVTIVANREPYMHDRGPDGAIRVLHPASGLVTALEPVMRACSGVWVAHGSGSADRETADRHGRVRVPPGEESYVLRRVWLTPEEERGYYYGFSNEGLWPLCHVAHTRPIFRGDDWAHYQRVNRKFADAVASEVDSLDPIIFVQDYHFGLAPRMIRDRLPRATILNFWHIPWPNAERFGICPWNTELLHGMLGSSILGFHTQLHCNNFLDAVDRYLEARIDREEHAVIHRGHATLVRAYPISIEWPTRWLRDAPPVEACRAEVFADLRLRPDALLGVGIDRLDYTKGIEERLLAVERLLERYPHLRGRFAFAQLAAPSRTAIERYKELNRSVEQLAARINRRFGSETYRPIILMREHHEPPTVFKYYRAADVCYVSSLDDGMNLVAKEFVAARDDERGVLVLSSFTGAARELTEALIVNPYDMEQASSALMTALSMSVEEQEERMRAMRMLLAEFNVYRWAGRMLVDAARLRQRDRIYDRLVDHLKQTEEAAS
jgi:trehalose 6-phosphate synthase